MNTYHLPPTTYHLAFRKKCFGHTLDLSLSEEFYKYFNVHKKGTSQNKVEGKD